jgi:hypothetical protein
MLRLSYVMHDCETWLFRIYYASWAEPEGDDMGVPHAWIKGKTITVFIEDKARMYMYRHT